MNVFISLFTFKLQKSNTLYHKRHTSPLNPLGNTDICFRLRIKYGVTIGLIHSASFCRGNLSVLRTHFVEFDSSGSYVL